MDWKRGFTAAGVLMAISTGTVVLRSSTPVLAFVEAIGFGLFFMLPLIAAAIIERRDARRYRDGRPRATSHSDGPLW
jgi:hypothetical protein